MFYFGSENTPVNAEFFVPLAASPSVPRIKKVDNVIILPSERGVCASNNEESFAQSEDAL